MFMLVKKAIVLFTAASLFMLSGGFELNPVNASSVVHETRGPGSQGDLNQNKAAPVGKPVELGELRRKYSETFKFRGPEVKQIALTFDDGPDPRFTPQILDVLHRKGIKATFFVVGARAKKFPAKIGRAHV